MRKPHAHVDSLQAGVLPTSSMQGARSSIHRIITLSKQQHRPDRMKGANLHHKMQEPMDDSSVDEIQIHLDRIRESHIFDILPIPSAKGCTLIRPASPLVDTSTSASSPSRHVTVRTMRSGSGRSASAPLARPQLVMKPLREQSVTVDALSLLWATCVLQRYDPQLVPSAVMAILAPEEGMGLQGLHRLDLPQHGSFLASLQV